MADRTSLGSDDILTLNLYSILENLMSVIHTSETLAAESFSRNQITGSGDVTPGGYSEDLFIFLSQREKDEYTCSICYSMIKDVHQCSNGHKFCYSCIYVWSTCNRAGADCCPACRCDGIYARNKQLNDKIDGKRVKCQNEECNWRGFLRDYNDHGHRRYEFKELTRFIELPNIGSHDGSNISLDNNKGTLPESRSLLQMSEDWSRSSNLSHMIARMNRSNEIDRSQAAFNRSEVNDNLNNLPRTPEGGGTHRNNVDIGRQQQLEYHRLAPTYASRRHNVGFFHSDNAHLATILIFLSTDMDAVTTTSVTHTANVTTPSVASTSTGVSDEIPTLNQRLLDMASSSDFLVETTNVQSGSELVTTGVSGRSSGDDDDSSASARNSNDTE